MKVWATVPLSSLACLSHVLILVTEKSPLESDKEKQCFPSEMINTTAFIKKCLRTEISSEIFTLQKI